MRLLETGHRRRSTISTQRRRGDQAYHLEVTTTDGESIVIPVQAPESRGWMATYADELARAAKLTLIPVLEGYPTVIVAIPRGTNWVYYRKVVGQLVGPQAGVEDVYHFVGWQAPGSSVRHVACVSPVGSVLMTLETL